MSTTIGISQARVDLPTLVDRVSKKLERTFITVHGKTKAVMLSVEELESLEETAEILAIPGIKKSLKKSQEQFKKGEFVYLSDLK